MPEVTLNYWAILGGVVFSMALGYVWYSMPVFGRAWMQLIGKTEEDLKKGQGPAMGGMVVLAFILSFVLAHFVDYAEATTWSAGAMTGLWAWVGFILPTKGGDFLFEHKPKKLFMIEAGYALVQLVVIGAMLAIWV
jgi:UDP-N-acetylmuramyl pentapeptide phosphotransferase/UDP-N-acetylglucosamine-1-phosphate transferase